MEQEEGRAGRFGDCSERVIGACVEVHRRLGPGLLESAYKVCLAREFSIRGLRFERERPLALNYKGVELECGYRLDFVVQDELILEVKAVEELHAVHQAQVITYLKLTRLPAALLVNFHAEAIRRALRRFTLHPQNSGF